ncbi:MAG: hypothetical protein V4713_14115 [Pseudomonadota bacterium]
MLTASPAPHATAQNGPARLDWLMAASVAPGKALHLALLLHSLCAARPFPAVRLTRRMLAGHVSRDACYDGLRRLQSEHLLTVRRLPGRSPQVVLLEQGTDQALNFTPPVLKTRTWGMQALSQQSQL